MSTKRAPREIPIEQRKETLLGYLIGFLERNQARITAIHLNDQAGSNPKVSELAVHFKPEMTNVPVEFRNAMYRWHKLPGSNVQQNDPTQTPAHYTHVSSETPPVELIHCSEKIKTHEGAQVTKFLVFFHAAELADEHSLWS